MVLANPRLRVWGLGLTQKCLIDVPFCRDVEQM